MSKGGQAPTGGIRLDEQDRRLLNLVQAGLPLVERPFAAIGQQLDMEEEEVLLRLRRLKANGVIRRLGGIFNSRQLGYQGILCAAKIDEGELEQVASAIHRHPGVTHCYLREGELNLWFTVMAASEPALQREIAAIKAEAGLADVVQFPTERVYKIRVCFDLGQELAAQHSS